MSQAPPSKQATCRNCGEVIFWTRPRLPKWQEDENRAVQKANEVKEKLADKNLWNWQKTADLVELPHKIQGSWKEAWYHYREEEGTLSQCPVKRKRSGSGKYWNGPSAKPKEFCSEFVEAQYSRGPCNRKVKGEWNGEPLCGIHLARERKAEEKYRISQEEREITHYIIESTEELCKELEQDFGLKASVHLRRRWVNGGWEHTPDGRVVVDPKALLELLVETFDA